MSSITEVVPSPCIKTCVVEDEHCQGCGRSLDEIAQWRHMSNQEKQKVLDRLKAKEST